MNAKVDNIIVIVMSQSAPIPMAPMNVLAKRVFTWI